MLVNAVDILSKYVGESERNLRDLFAADGEWDAPHPATDGGPPLRVIVLDEMDALFRRRGGVGDADHDAGGARALYDGVTNQLLTLMDGTAAVREVLVIGLTNRLHAIDRALLRPGRFEVVIEIPAPDVAGREEMFAIHTRQLRATGCLDANVSLAELAQRSAGFSGADVAGAVRAATSYALQRHYEELQRHTGASSMDGKRTTMPDEAEGGADAPSSNAEDDFDEVVITGDTVMRTTRSRPGVAGRDGASDGSGAELAFRVTAHDFALALRDVAPRAVSDTPFAPIDYDGGVSRAVGVVRRLWSALHSGRGSRAAVVLLRGSPGAGKSCVARWLLVAVGCAERRVLRGSEDVDEALSAVRAAGDGCAVVDDADRLERDGRRRLREALRGLREGGGGRWLVVLTSTERLAWGGAEVDARLLLRPVEGAGLDAMLRHDRIVRNDTEPISALRRAFPAGIAFRVYRRLLDLALWRAKEEATGERAERFAKVAMGSSDATPLSEKEQTELATSIGSVASEMGLVDPSDGLVEMDYVIEGEEIDW